MQQANRSSNHHSVTMNRYLAWQVRVSSLNIMLLVICTVGKVEESHSLGR